MLIPYKGNQVISFGMAILKVSRVQKHIETLDALKLQNSKPRRNVGKIPWQQQAHSSRQIPIIPVQKQQGQQPLRHSESVVVTTQWETFD
jgi:hypothetical protein